MENRQQKVLVVDDDPLIRKMVRLTCEGEGYLVLEAERGVDALALIDSGHPDIVLLDLMMPDASGFDVCRVIRGRGHGIPVLILSAKNEEIDVVLGLEIGADDYIQKPFRPRELVARLAAHLRKARDTERNGRVRRLVFRGLEIDVAERRVVRGEQDIPLTHTEFDLLAFLASHAGQVLSREKILSVVWGYQQAIETRVIDVHVRNLRRKLETDPAQPRLILAVPGIGYRFVDSRPRDTG